MNIAYLPGLGLGLVLVIGLGLGLGVWVKEGENMIGKKIEGYIGCGRVIYKEWVRRL